MQNEESPIEIAAGLPLPPGRSHKEKYIALCWYLEYYTALQCSIAGMIQQ